MKNLATMNYALLATVLVALVLWPDILSSAAISATDQLASRPVFNRIIASILILVAFPTCAILHRKRSLHAVQRVLGAYAASALGMAAVYYLVYRSHTHCFISPESTSGVALSVFDFIYFSFVTISTLGYGDIVPRHALVRLLVVFQILFGVWLIMQAAVHRPDGGNHK